MLPCFLLCLFVIRGMPQISPSIPSQNKFLAQVLSLDGTFGQVHVRSLDFFEVHTFDHPLEPIVQNVSHNRSAVLAVVAVFLLVFQSEQFHVVVDFFVLEDERVAVVGVDPEEVGRVQAGDVFVERFGFVLGVVVARFVGGVVGLGQGQREDEAGREPVQHYNSRGV